MGKNNDNNTKRRLSNKTLLLMVTALIFISLASASSLADPVIMSTSGNNIRHISDDSLLEVGNLKVLIYDVPTAGSPIYEEEFDRSIKEGSWDVDLGTEGDLDLSCGEPYYIDYDIENESVEFEDNDGNPQDRKKFISNFNCKIPTCTNGKIIKYNGVDGNWSCAEDNSTAMPACSENQLLRTTSGDWACDTEPQLPDTCVNDKLLVMDSGNWACKSKSEVQLNNSQIEDAVGNWAAVEPDYYTSAEVNAECTNAGEVSAQIEAESFPGSWDNLTSIPADIADGDDDTQLTNSSVEDIITNANFASQLYVDDAVFSGSWDNLTSIPADIADGDDDTQLTNAQVSTLFLEINPNTDLNSGDDFSGLYADLSGAPNLTAYDTNVSDDFGGSFNSLTDIPSGLSDGDNNTQLNSTDVLNYVDTAYPLLDTDDTDDFSGLYADLSGAPNLTAYDTNASDDFDGNWSSLSDVPSGLSDGDNNTQLNNTEVSNAFLTIYPNTDLNLGDDLTPANVVSAVGNWSNESDNYYLITDFNDGNVEISWDNITSIPADLVDGDDDTQLTNAQVSTLFLEINPNTDLNSGDDFSGLYNDLSGAPNLTAYDTNASDDFSGSFNNLIDVPSGLSDGDNNTQLNSTDVLNYVDTAYPLLDTDDTDDFSGLYNDLSGAPNLTAYDTNASDDFDGNWSSLSDVPSGLSDGDNNTQLNSTEVIGYIDTAHPNWDKDSTNDFSGLYADLSGAPNLTAYDTNASDDFDGNWSSLSDVPSDLADGDANTQLNNTEVSNAFLTIYPNTDLNLNDDLTPANVVSAVGNWSNESDNYYLITDFNDGNVEISWDNITSIPADIADGDNNTQLNSTEVIGYIDTLHPNWDKDSTNDFSGLYNDLSGAPNLTAYDTNASDDFDGNWTSLESIPSDIADGDDDTTYIAGNGVGIDGDGNITLKLKIDGPFSFEDGRLKFGEDVCMGVPIWNCSSDTWIYDTATYLEDKGDTATGNYIFDSGTLMIDADNDKIGIGTKIPNTKLHIKTSGGNELKYALELQNPSNTAGDTSTGILFGTDTNSSYAKGALVYQRNSTSGKGDFHFLQKGGIDGPGNPELSNSVLTIKTGGFVGIGDKSPAVKLDVDGLIRTAPRTSATCDTTTEGAIYYKSTDNTFYGCNSTDWVALS